MNSQSLLSVSMTEPTDQHIMRTFVDPQGLLQFISSQYLERYIREGGSKVKIVYGSRGCGKSHFLRALADRARNVGYVVACIDARGGGIDRIDNLYRATMASQNPWDFIRSYARRVITTLGYVPDNIPEGKTFVEWCLASGRVLEILRREILDCLEADLRRESDMDQSFSLCLMQMTWSYLGVPGLDPQRRNALEKWIKGEPVEAKDRRRAGLFHQVDRYTARYMLHSLIGFLRKAGYSGLCIFVDNLDVILGTNPLTGRPYGRSRRDDVYETLRELIDDVDLLPNFLAVLACYSSLVDDANGFRSYPALWMRLQNEVATREVNKFSDLIDLDRVVEQDLEAFLREVLARWSETLGVPSAISETEWRAITSRGSVSPVRRLVGRMLAEKGG